MKNLLTYLQHKHKNDILLYFMDIAKEEVQGDKWNEDNNWIIYATDKFMEEGKLDDIGLSGAQIFIATQKKEIEEVPLSSI